ncbi:hypothetical protein IL306_010247 [Fusarium sp. DS 682]|nr:hypothetical protein IL306_010247 [Fusarium sp. DS 682]
MPHRSVKLNSAAITFRGKPFKLNPLINDILRTKHCVPGSIFLVEGVDRAPVSRSGKWQMIRLFLGDGELCIQAVLAPNMHRFVNAGEIALGAYVQCEEFDLDSKEVGEQTMVMLKVKNLITVGWNESYRALRKRDELVHKRILALKRLNKPAPRPKAKSIIKQPETSKKPRKPTFEDGMEFDDVDEAAAPEAFNAFEKLMMATAPKTPQKPRTPQKAKTPQQVPTPQKKETPRKTKIPPKPLTPLKLKEPQKTTTSHKPQRPQTPQNTEILQETPTPHQPIALPRDWHNYQTPLKLTTLRQIPHLPYAQNWSCNVLAIVSHLSAIEPANLPPYKQRTARLADPSTAKQVHLTVFLDPEAFNPQVGSAVLLVGVKNHRFDGGSLKKYESDRENGRWWFENPVEMEWCDVDKINAWWAQVTTATQG